jgi:hypothetical protein
MGILTVPIWVAGAASAVFLVAIVLAIGKAGAAALIASLFRVARSGRLDWITALRAPAIRALGECGALQMSLFHERDMAAITSPDYPGDRLIVCHNPDLAPERTRKRLHLLAATERNLAEIAAAVSRARKPLRGQAKIRRRR